MKKINKKIIIVVFFAMINLIAQAQIHLDKVDYCSSLGYGIIHVGFNEQELGLDNPIELPVEIYWDNVTGDDYGYVNIGQSDQLPNGDFVKDFQVPNAGHYELYINFNENCNAFEQINLHDITTKIEAVKTNPKFATGCQDGRIDITLTDGVPPYTVQWRRNGTIIQTSTSVQGSNAGEDLENLGPGNYEVSVTDFYCGTVTMNFRLQCECTDYCKIYGEVTPVTCYGGGSIMTTLDCTGKLPPGTYTYHWSNGSIQQNLTSLASGEYCLTVTDQRFGCSFEKCWEVLDMVEDGPIITLVDKQSIPLCKSENPICLGSIEISVGPGTSVEWQNLEDPSQTFSTTISGLCLGSYTVIAYKDGCSATKTFYIECCNTISAGSQSSIEPIDFNANVSSTTNVEANNGSISLAVTGGGIIDYSWTGPNGFISNSQNINNLTPGEYCVVAQDGCSKLERCYRVYDCTTISISSITGVSQNTCINPDGNDISSGEINISVLGGIEPYEYHWSNGASSKNIESLPVGTYCVTVTESSGCPNVASMKCFDINSEAVIVVRERCVKKYYCKEELYFTEDLIESTRPSQQHPFDCRYVEIYCEQDGLVLGEEYYPYIIEEDFENCKVIKKCPSNGDIDEEIDGETSVYVNYGFDNSESCWYCDEITQCDLGDDFGSEITNVNSIIAISSITGNGETTWKVYCDTNLDNEDEVIFESTTAEPNACIPTVVEYEEINELGQKITYYKTRLKDLSIEIREEFEREIKERVLKNRKLLESDFNAKNKNTGDKIDIITLYPSPFISLLNVEINLIQEDDVFIEIYTLKGKIIKTIDLKNVKIINKVVDLRGLGSGIYLARIMTSNQIVIKKVLKL